MYNCAHPKQEYNKKEAKFRKSIYETDLFSLFSRKVAQVSSKLPGSNNRGVTISNATISYFFSVSWASSTMTSQNSRTNNLIFLQRNSDLVYSVSNNDFQLVLLYIICSIQVDAFASPLVFMEIFFRFKTRMFLGIELSSDIFKSFSKLQRNMSLHSY